MINIQHHLREIRFRLIYVILSTIFTFLISYHRQLELIYIIGKPFIKLQQTFVFLELTEAFYILLKISMILTTLVMVPFIGYHFFGFFIPSFYETERNQLIFQSCFFFFLILCEVLWTYLVVFPKICEFLIGFEVSYGSESHFKPLVTVEFTARIEAYVKLLVKTFTLLVLILQLPVLIFFLYSKKLLHGSHFYCNRKICALVSVLLSAFVVPPDVVSQIVLSLVFVVVFEIFIFIGLFFDDHFDAKN